MSQNLTAQRRQIRRRQQLQQQQQKQVTRLVLAALYCAIEAICALNKLTASNEFGSKLNLNSNLNLNINSNLKGNSVRYGKIKLNENQLLETAGGDLKFALEAQAQASKKRLAKSNVLHQPKTTNNWTKDVNANAKTKSQNEREIQTETKTQIQTNAQYAPTLRLLTTEEPMTELDALIAGGSLVGVATTAKASQVLTNKARTISGNIGNDVNRGKSIDFWLPNAPSKYQTSQDTLNAIKMHNELLKPAPRDGKVRVRMYFHQATHDLSHKLTNGEPWRFDGNGWGVEYAFDPQKSVDAHTARGYSIERRFERHSQRLKQSGRINNKKREDEDKSRERRSKR